MAMLAASLWMMTGFALQMGDQLIIWSGLVQGVAIALMIIPTNLISVSTLDQTLRTDGTALYSLLRAIGGSVAIAIVSALLARSTQINHAEIGAWITPSRFPPLTPEIVTNPGVQAALKVTDLEIARQAAMIGYLNDFWLMMWSVIVMMPIVLILRPARAASDGALAHVGE